MSTTKRTTTNVRGWYPAPPPPPPLQDGWLLSTKLHGWGTLKLKYSKSRLRWSHPFCIASRSVPDTLIKRRYHRTTDEAREWTFQNRKKRIQKQIIPSESQWLVVLLATVWDWCCFESKSHTHTPAFIHEGDWCSSTMRMSACYSFLEPSTWPFPFMASHTIWLCKQYSNFLIASSCFA